MFELRKGLRTGAMGVAGAVACTALVACGSDSSDAGDKSAEKNQAEKKSPGVQEDGTAAVRTAYDKTAEAETARMTLTTRTSAQGKSVAAKGQGVIDLSEGDSEMTLSAGGQRIEQRVVDGIVYQKLPKAQQAKVPGKKPWVKIDLAKAAQQNGGSSQVNDPAESAGFAKGVTDKDVKKIGTEQIAGTNTTRYRVTVDVDKLARTGDPAKADRLKKQLGPTLPMDVWLDDDGRIRRQQMDMHLKAPGGAAADGPQKADVRTVIEFSDFGAELDVEPPAAARTADLTGRAKQ
ncbi:hypothetical protein AS594_22055 [Streptomyces agglomeratus]|uniref:LppX_LprAFG lipoprotein n=1 Tax=Streptomyces agglomeratus TaxID=285458 RepID=A0A1E5PB52_9ACTN|nr:LppX_LprAFG lipoprotein [Streptomyces agglomeratus]OEJ26770.1 hypothetical protein AS594_22055 [Streptomyces agglomeratus]